MVNNCRLELEDQTFLAAQGEVPQAFMAFQRPAEVGVDWHKSENQGQIGSCQGNDLSSCLERLHFVRKRENVQLSRIFAYLATQKIDGLLGVDQGSTITGGMKLAMQYGVCLEAATGYPSKYPTPAQIKGILAGEHYTAGAPYKAATSCILGADPEQAMNLIGGGGAVTFGIGWYTGLIPKDRIVRKYTPPLKCGGHANAVLGYTKDGLLIAINSWGDGPYKITPEAWQQMVKRKGNVFGGLMGNQGTPIDWVKDSPWNFGG